MSVAYVLSGGGSLGAVQVGMLLALVERGIKPELLIGSSVGALNAAWVAARPDLEGVRQLAQVWRGIRRQDVFPFSLHTRLLGLAGARDYLISSANLRNLIEDHLSFGRLEDAPTPLIIIATEVLTGHEVVLDRGPAAQAVLASAAIPGVFPPVVVGSRLLMDGGVSNNTPISQAVQAGATTIYVLPTGYACALTRPPHGALGAALHAINLAIQQRLLLDVARYQDCVDLRVLPSPCPHTVSPIDFSRTAALIDQSHAESAAWLDSGWRGSDQTRFLRAHQHAAASLRGAGNPAANESTSRV